MEVVESTLNHFAILGIRSNQSLTNVNFFMIELIFILQICSNCIFLIFVADTFREYTYGMFFASSNVMVTSIFTIFAIKRTHFFKMIDIVEEMVEKSE